MITVVFLCPRYLLYVTREPCQALRLAKFICVKRRRKEKGKKKKSVLNVLLNMDIFQFRSLSCLPVILYAILRWYEECFFLQRGAHFPMVSILLYFGNCKRILLTCSLFSLLFFLPGEKRQCFGVCWCLPAFRMFSSWQSLTLTLIFKGPCGLDALTLASLHLILILA